MPPSPLWTTTNVFFSNLTPLQKACVSDSNNHSVNTVIFIAFKQSRVGNSQIVPYHTNLMLFLHFPKLAKPSSN